MIMTPFFASQIATKYATRHLRHFAVMSPHRRIYIKKCLHWPFFCYGTQVERIWTLYFSLSQHAFQAQPPQNQQKTTPPKTRPPKTRPRRRRGSWDPDLQLIESRPPPPDQPTNPVVRFGTQLVRPPLGKWHENIGQIDVSHLRAI